MKFVLSLLLLGACAAQAQSLGQLKPNGVTIDEVEYKGSKCVRVAQAKGGGVPQEATVAVVEGSSFRDGVIELEVASLLGTGAAEAARGFIGLAFRVQPGVSKFDAFYVRPTNARADDQVRRNHSLQYISYPDYPWHRLRKETPEKYESYSDLEVGEWTRLKIEVKGSKARLYVNGASQPSLIVNDLKLGETSGALALWVGPGTIGHFRGLKVSQ